MAQNQDMPGGLAVSPAEAHSLLSDQGIALLDARNASDFRASHVTGATNVPMDQLEANLSWLLNARLILVYDAATEDESDLSIHIVRVLRAHGCNAFAIAGGLEAWVSHGFATTPGQ